MRLDRSCVKFAPWDCFGEAIAFCCENHEVAREIGPKTLASLPSTALKKKKNKNSNNSSKQHRPSQGND